MLADFFRVNRKIIFIKVAILNHLDWPENLMSNTKYLVRSTVQLESEMKKEKAGGLEKK